MKLHMKYQAVDKKQQKLKDYFLYRPGILEAKEN